MDIIIILKTVNIYSHKNKKIIFKEYITYIYSYE
jgi:hypothetical protein